MECQSRESSPRIVDGDMDDCCIVTPVVYYYYDLECVVMCDNNNNTRVAPMMLLLLLLILYNIVGRRRGRIGMGARCREGGHSSRSSIDVVSWQQRATRMGIDDGA